MGSKKVLKGVAIGAAIAGAAGYIAGVLSAPAEGKKTRKKLQKTAVASMGEAERQLKALHTELGELVSEAKTHSGKMSDHAQKKLNGALDNARLAKDKLRGVLSAVHEGEASDKDLSNALEDARRSLEHLKQYLKK